jgi:hypothetical protein
MTKISKLKENLWYFMVVMASMVFIFSLLNRSALFSVLCFIIVMVLSKYRKNISLPRQSDK